MNKKLKFILDNYKNDSFEFDKILINAFLVSNNIKNVNNSLIKSYALLEKKEIDELSNIIDFVLSFDDLIEAFELGVSDKEKVINGAVYTPNQIKDFIVNHAFKKARKQYESLLIGDISCGCGAFLFTIATKIKELTDKPFEAIFRENIFGLDISSESILRTKILLSLLAVYHNEDETEYQFNLYCSNALSFNWLESNEKINENNGFDIIVGNPPYVRTKNLDLETKKLLQNWSVTKSGNPDLYIPFFEIGLKYLTPEGILGFITVNSFYKSVNARALRYFLKDNAIGLDIIDFGGERIFDKSAYTCICFISKKNSDSVSFIKLKSSQLDDYDKKVKNNIYYATLDSQRGWLLNDNAIVENIKKIESCGQSLGSLFTIRNGIATLANDTYIFKPEMLSGEYYYFTKKGKTHKIEKSICRNIIKPNILKYEHQIDDVMEKLLFPYRREDGILKILNEKEFKELYPFAYSYLLSYKDELSKRDKGEANYEEWFAFGRTQGLNGYGYKLLFPYMGSKPHFVFTDEEDLLIYCGYAIFSESKDKLLVLKKILESSVFEYYIKNTSKPYSGGFVSYAKNYVQNFGVCQLSLEEFEYLLNEKDTKRIDAFLMQKYQLVTDRNTKKNNSMELAKLCQ